MVAGSIRIGQRLGRYRVIAPLGRGGMAAVFRAEETSLGREVALKVLPAELMEEPGFLERFEREAQLIARLEHPNIVPLYASGIDDGIPWMALRLMTHGTLQDRLQAGDLGIEEGLALFGQVARALDYAHARGVLHRDLKPQNVLLGTDVSACLADFGIAGMLSGRSDLTGTGMMLGTPSYMAPEQALAQDLTPACDYYPLAVMLYRWLCGQVPFDADTPLAVMMKHAREPVPVEPMQGLPEAVQNVLLSGLAKQPEERGNSAQAMIQALAPALQSDTLPTVVQERPVELRDSTRHAGPSDFGVGRARPWRRVVPALLVLGMILAGGWYWMPRGSDSESLSVADAERDLLPMSDAESDAGDAGAPSFAGTDRAPITSDLVGAEPSGSPDAPMEADDPDPLLQVTGESGPDVPPENDLQPVQAQVPDTPKALLDDAQSEPLTPVPAKPVAEAMPEEDYLEDELASVEAPEEDRLEGEPVAEPPPEEARREVEPTEETETDLPAGTRFRDCPECPEMIVIPAGRFVMGSPADEPQRQATEGPQREVEIGRFALARFETRFAEWDLCQSEGGCRHRPDDGGWGGGEQPVIDVSWNDAQDYLAWLSARTGERYRLPSEAEWEYAARAGTEGRHYLGDCFDSEDANFNARWPAQGCPKGEFRQRTLPVSSFPANPFGLHDMHGNVWEWVQDCANANYQGAPGDGSAWMRGDCNRGTVRGGAWHDWGFWLRAASRYSFPRDSRHDVGGFRVARELP